MTARTTIGLLFGGRSAEHEVSIQSAAAVHRHLDPGRFDIVSIYIDKQGFWTPVDRPDAGLIDKTEGHRASFLPWALPDNRQRLDVDVYFPVLHGPFGEDGTIQGLFEMADVPYVGAAVLGSAVGMDKAVAKALFRDRGLPVPRFLVLLERDYRTDPEARMAELEDSFSCPFFVKPANLGSSVGITKVKAWDRTSAALESAFRYDAKVLIEEAVQGREIECSVLGNDDPRASLPGEVLPHREFYDYRDKYVEGKTGFAIPADLPASLIEDIQRMSVEAFLAVSACGMARVDFFLRRDPEQLFLNEINTIPGFTEISMYPKLWEVSGLPFADLLERLIDLARERHRTKKRNTLWE